MTAASIVAMIHLFSTALVQERADRNQSGYRTSLPASAVVDGDYFAAGELWTSLAPSMVISTHPAVRS
jgi:hypothetical protein